MPGGRVASHRDSESRRGWFDPNPGIHKVPCGVIGNMPAFEAGESRFETWRGSQYPLL